MSHYDLASTTVTRIQLRKSKEYIYNYVDRVRFAESSFPDYKCPSRGSGWRHNKSISHLDLATSCHSAAAGLNHWSSSHQTRHHQLRHSRSLDYNHIDRCKDALDIAEYYWRVEPEPEIYDEEEEKETVIEPEQHTGPQQQTHSQQQLKYVSEHHLTQHYRDFKCADENYHHSTNNIYQSTQQLQHQQQQQQQHPHQPRQQIQPQQQQPQHQSSNGSIPPQAFEFASDSCSLRRSRSLAVIREETFSDLQISSSNGSRRSQLIPRARLVNRGYFRERERLICGNNKHHHHHHTSREQLTTNCNCNNSGCNTGTGAVNGCYCQDLDEQSNESIADTCDSHQQQLQLIHHKQQQQQQQSQHLHYHPHYHDTQTTVGAAATTNDYYEHLKRLDKLALGIVTEQLHPWHNDKSDLESLNSDYFKNSLHQSNDLKQHHHQQHLHQHPQQQQQLEFENFEQAVHLLAQEKPRIYQSRRQKRSSNLEKSQKLLNSTPASGGESCPENSQSSVFPETTTSNSDDQTDSASLSEQEYDITKIEEIFQKTQIEGDEESYEIISLTTTTRTRFETTEDEAEDPEEEEELERERDRFLEEQINTHRFRNESDAISQEEEQEEEADDTEESNRHTTTDTEIEGTLKRARAVSDNLQKIIAYDSVYLSSEESSDCTLIDLDACDTSLEVASLCTCIDEVETLLHISIEDTIYEPKAKQHKFEVNCNSQDSILTQPETVSYVETVNTKIEILDQLADHLNAEDIKPIYTQILKIEHTPSSSTPHTACIPAGVTSSAASKPKILSVVEKRKLKRYSDSAYSSNVSDSSDKALTPTTKDSSAGCSAYTQHASHLKRQVAEPLYIPLKTNLSDNQYHSLPDVNIGQSLKVSESIDAQLRSSYNLENCCSLDHDAVDECHLKHETAHTSSILINNSNSNCKTREEVVTSEEIYDSIKRFGRAHQQFKQKQSEEDQQHHEKEESWSSENSFEIEEDNDTTPIPHLDTAENYNVEKTSEPTADINKRASLKQEIEFPLEQNSDSTKSPSSYSPQQIYESLEKHKDAPGIEIENFSQQIERRAKEIRASGRRTQLQQIEFANRAKFRLENTLSQYEDIQEETKENKCNKLQNKISKNSLFRIVVTDAQNNIIEEDSIESLETKEVKKAEEKENFNLSNSKKKNNRIENTDEVLVVRFSKERLKEKPVTSGSVSNRFSGSLKRVPSKHKRQQYPTTATAANGSSQHLSIAEAKKLLLSPKSKERRVLSNQIYRARPVKVITTTTTTTTTTDSFRRNKVKHQSNKMSRPQILQVIDNKRKLENGLTVAGNPTTATPTSFNANNICHNNGEGTQVENEYLKKVDAVRCYWSKLVNSDLEQQQLQQQHEADDVLEEEEGEDKKKEQPANNQDEKKLVKQKAEVVNEQQQPAEYKEQKSYTKQSKKTNGMENLNESQPQQPLQQKHQEPQRYEEKKQFILGAQPTTITTHSSPDQVDNRVHVRNVTMTSGDSHKKTLPSNNHYQDDYCSFMPSIEIVELDGDKKATIVSAVPSNLSSLGGNQANDADIDDANEPQFDHIRYKVLKSQQLLRSNVLARNKKEAQFDGLIQYLQEYSFQELLSNNNVVIVEPVRTKIERPSGTHNTITGRLAKDTSTQLIANEGKRKERNVSGGNTNRSVRGSVSGFGSSGIKRHFFYQPVRVNRELYEEELPNPDTVRNVRKFFEEHILPTPGQGLLTKASEQHAQQQQQNGANKTVTKQTSPKSRRARKYRYLTIDTSYGHATTAAAAAATKQPINSPQRKWDTASLSSGISSGDLSSPCECNDMENNQKHTETMPAAACNNKAMPQKDLESNEEHLTSQEPEDDDAAKPVHVQDLVRKHNSTNTVRKPRTTAFGVPVRSSGIRPRSTIYGSLHKSSKSSNYRDIYEYHIKHAYHDSDDHEAADDDKADEDDDDNDLFGDVEDDEDELCDTYYVSNDILRKIRECGSSVTYYGGRVVQTTSTSAATNPLETYGCGNNGHYSNNTIVNNATTMSLKNPTMMTQTQTRARVREIETCCNNAAEGTAAICSMKATNNECHNHGKHLEQKKFHLIKNGNVANNGAKTATPKDECNQNNSVKHKAQCYRGGGDKADHNGGVGITFKLVKSNSCSSRLELAGATDNEPEETEVVRKMVHHFEATKTISHTRMATQGNDTTLTINNQTYFQDNEVGNNNRSSYNYKANNEVHAQIATPVKIEGQRIEKKNHDCGIKLVTVNNHINIAKESSTESSAENDLIKTIKRNLKEEFQDKQEEDVRKTEEQKMYHSEAKDIHLDNSGGNAYVNGATCVKICRNKNVDLAFTFVKHQPTNSSGMNAETANNITHIEKEEQVTKDKDGLSKKLVTYENTLLPTITATTKIKKPNKILMGDLKVDDAQTKSNTITTNSSNTNTSLGGTAVSSFTHNKPAQIIVPVEIHRVDIAKEPKHMANFATYNTSLHNTTPTQCSKSGVDEKSFLPLSTTSSVTSVIDKTVVKHYVANDKSIYEKRKYDDIEFEEFEIYDPTKDFEKLIEEEQKRNNPDTHSSFNNTQQITNQKQQLQQHSTTSSLSSNTSKASATSSMANANSQQTVASTETETDCYDSLDDKL